MLLIYQSPSPLHQAFDLPFHPFPYIAEMEMEMVSSHANASKRSAESSTIDSRLKR